MGHASFDYVWLQSFWRNNLRGCHDGENAEGGADGRAPDGLRKLVWIRQWAIAATPKGRFLISISPKDAEGTIGVVPGDDVLGPTYGNS